MSKRTVNQWHYIIEGLHDYNVLLDTREIFLHGDLSCGEDAGVDHVMANRLIKNLRLLETQNAEPIVIHQHSIGGDWYAGMAIFNAIVSCKCRILFVCHGQASSMGSIIPQACVPHGDAYRVVMPDCDWLIHQGSTTFDGTYKQGQSWADVEKRIVERMMNIYSASCMNGKFFKDKKYDEKRVARFLEDKMDSKEDWWLTSKEAVEYGFADAIMGDEGYESINDILKSW